MLYRCHFTSCPWLPGHFGLKTALLASGIYARCWPVINGKRHTGSTVQSATAMAGDPVLYPVLLKWHNQRMADSTAKSAVASAFAALFRISVRPAVYQMWGTAAGAPTSNARVADYVDDARSTCVVSPSRVTAAMVSYWHATRSLDYCNHCICAGFKTHATNRKCSAIHSV